VSEVSHLDFLEKKAMKGGLISFTEEEGLLNRRLLCHAMTEEGFAPNPTEWWHYSYGDQMWAALTKNSEAFYGECFIDGDVLID